MNRLVALAVVAGLSFAGCGGMPDSERFGYRSEASSAAAELGQACIALGGLSTATVIPSGIWEQVDKMLDAYENSQNDSGIRSTLRESAGTLRDCKQDDQAARLERAADED